LYRESSDDSFLVGVGGDGNHIPAHDCLGDGVRGGQDELAQADDPQQSPIPVDDIEIVG
jgi:hypothetical protein